MKRIQEEEVKGPPELISNNPKLIDSSDESDQVKFNYILWSSQIFCYNCRFLKFICRKRKMVTNIKWKSYVNIN